VDVKDAHASPDKRRLWLILGVAAGLTAGLIALAWWLLPARAFAAVLIGGVVLGGFALDRSLADRGRR
jgi:predicted lysophospholipase L1 biosynthesis ABC-type transport system permease subunit